MSQVPSNKKWRCRICGDNRYITIESEFEKVAKKWKAKYYACRGCSIVFSNPYKFNDAEEEETT
jgi:transposase-like protein